ncbi:MAG: hypothetical protein ACMUJM_04365 [bacterium]
MRHRFFIMLPLLILSCVLLVVKTSWANREPAVLWQYSAPSPIRQIAYRQFFDSTKRSFPIQAVLTEGEIIFFDTNGKREREKKLAAGEEGLFSPDGSFYLILHHRNNNPSLEVEKILIYEARGTLKKELVVEGRVWLSPDNKYLVIISLKKSRVSFYDIAGNLLKEYPLDNPISVNLDFSEDGHYCLLYLFNSLSTLFVYNDQGEFLWHTQEDRLPGKAAMSASGKHIIFYTEETLSSFLLDEKATSLSKDNKYREDLYRLAWKERLYAGGIKAAISDRGDTLALVREANRRVVLFDNQNGQILWKHDLLEDIEGLSGHFTSLSLSDDYLLVTADKSRQKANDTCYLYLFNAQGDLCWERSFAASDIKGRIKGGYIEVVLAHRVELYEMRDHRFHRLQR